jgi:hypothetical protein
MRRLVVSVSLGLLLCVGFVTAQTGTTPPKKDATPPKSSAAPKMIAVQAGVPAPDFPPGIFTDGGRYSMEDFKGKALALYFFEAG